MITVTDFVRLEYLQTQERIQFFDVVDALRPEGLSEYTALPQLVVCGDHSSGKSSLKPNENMRYDYWSYRR